MHADEGIVCKILIKGDHNGARLVMKDAERRDRALLQSQILFQTLGRGKAQLGAVQLRGDSA